MIPTIQMVPTPIMPFVSLFDPNYGQYLVQISPYNFPYLQGVQLANLPLNYYSTIPTQTSFGPFNDSKSAQTNFSKSENQNTKIKNLSDNSSIYLLIDQQNDYQIEINRSGNIQNKALSAAMRKKNQFKDRILKITQNRNRNIIPSVVQQIFSYLSKPNKSKTIALKVFSLLPKPEEHNFTIKRYFYFIKQIKDKLNHYLNVNSLCVLSTVQNHCLELIPAQEQMFYLEVARRVAKHFVQNQLPLLIIHSKKMFEDKRIQHFKVRRVLVEVLQNLEC